MEQFSPRVQRNVETFSEPVRVRNENESVAPFEQVIRPGEVTINREDVEATVPVVAYQPTVLAGEVVNIDNDDIFLQTPSGQVETIVMEGHGRHHGWWHHIVAIPVIETDGVYYAQPAAFVQAVPASYIYPNSIYPSSFVPMSVYDPYAAYGSPYGYNSGNIVSSLLTATLASYVVSYLMGSHPSLSSIASSVLPAVASSALGGGSYLTPAYAPTYVAPAYTTSYVAPAAYNPVTGYSYPTTCVYTDPITGLTSYDPACAPATTTSYYASPNVYAPEQLQGVVVGTSGSTLMVLGANGLTPILVNDAPALQSGNLFNGQPTTGRVVTAYGFYSGSTFVATALQ
ncbi:MAG TPA: hypothetical protein VGR69_08935 [Candidatus Rubrimentiphilum sp.]|nr:hypothetical protein [Candidatus Rubrimentiphilum sp.]